MAHTARCEAETVEHFDSPEELKLKVTTLANMVHKAKHLVAFTGAGISTSAGIPDFRSGVNTCLETGAGKWARDAAEQQGIEVKPASTRVSSTIKAYPTTTHMTLVQLQDMGKLKCIISQNTDGLHRRSGMAISHIAELHGNSTQEVCAKCGKQYFRDYRVRSAKTSKAHETGRTCDNDKCGGVLLDTIVNFGESLPQCQYRKAEEHTQLGDVCIALGSSLTVTPAADFAAHFGKNKKKRLVIVNLQPTPLDHLACVRIWAKTDTVMEMMMSMLEIPIPTWKLRRYIEVETTTTSVSVRAIDSTGCVNSIFKSIQFASRDGTSFSKTYQKPATAANPLIGHAACNITSGVAPGDVQIIFTFHGHYQEPIVTFDVGAYPELSTPSTGTCAATFRLQFDPVTVTWGPPENIRSILHVDADSCTRMLLGGGEVQNPVYKRGE